MALTPEQKAELKKQEKALFEEDPSKLPTPPRLNPAFPGGPRVFGQDVGLDKSGGGAGEKDNEDIVNSLERISAQIIETQDIISNLPAEIARELGVP